MKIALIGAQGVGKTTLGHAMKQKYPTSNLVRETVRECPYPCDQRADFKTEWWVLTHSILAEQEARESKAPLIITDRCLLDVAVYTKLINQSNDGRLTSIQRSMIESSIDGWFQDFPYDYMFFLKVSPEVWKTRELDDGFRSLDFEWYSLLTKEFELAIEKFKIPQRTQLITVMNDGPFDDTLATIEKTLGFAEQTQVAARA